MLDSNEFNRRTAKKVAYILINWLNFFQKLKKYDKIELVGFMTMGKDQDEVATEEAFKKNV